MKVEHALGLLCRAVSRYHKGRNIDLQSVRPAGLQPAAPGAAQPANPQIAEIISTGRTGNMPMFRPLL